MIPKYKEKLWNCFSKRRVQERLADLVRKQELGVLEPEVLRKLDEDITRSMIAAEKFGGANIRHLPWSTELMLKGIWVKY